MTDAGPTPIAPKRLSAFISHHSSQVDTARLLKQRLATHGIDGWLAPDDIAAGTAFDQAILDQIGRSDAIILLLCPQSDQSRHVKRELMLGEDSNKQILPVRLEDIQAQGLAYWLKDYQWIDWFRGEVQAVDKIVAAMTGASAVVTPVRVAGARQSKYRFAKLAAAALALLLAAAGAWWALKSGGADGAANADVADSPIEPGIWTSKREVVKILFPEEIAPEYETQFKALLENDPDPEDCINAKVAAKPDVELFDPGRKSSCTIGSFKMNGGRISGYLNCKIAGDPNGNLQVTVRGTYTRTSMEFDNVVTMQTSQGMVRFRSHETQNWLRGPACKA
jgi:hypothetical protein